MPPKKPKGRGGKRGGGAGVDPNLGKHIPHNPADCLPGHRVHDLARRIGMTTGKSIKILDPNDRVDNQRRLMIHLGSHPPEVRNLYLEEFEEIYKK